MSQCESDALAIKVPQGWVLAGHNETTGMDYTLSPAVSSSPKGPLLAVRHWGAADLFSLFNYPVDLPFDVDLDEAFRSRFFSTKSGQGIIHLEELPERTIGAAPAVGYTFVYRDTPRSRAAGSSPSSIDAPARLTEWIVVRRDGEWQFFLKSAPGSTEIPQELEAALDTVGWALAGATSGRTGKYRCPPSTSSSRTTPSPPSTTSTMGSSSPSPPEQPPPSR